MRASFYAVLAGLLALPFAARANTGLTGATPSADSVAQGMPGVVELDFSQGVQAARSTLTVRDAKGRRVDDGAVHLVGDNRHIAVNLKSLLPGRYLVQWSTIGVDAHPVQGGYAFTVAQ